MSSQRWPARRTQALSGHLPLCVVWVELHYVDLLRACCTANPQQIAAMEIELHVGRRVNISHGERLLVEVVGDAELDAAELLAAQRRVVGLLDVDDGPGTALVTRLSIRRRGTNFQQRLVK